jgi:hypothetical protein
MQIAGIIPDNIRINAAVLPLPKGRDIQIDPISDRTLQVDRLEERY